ncbi:multidrug ABC transporter ATP-binding protein [Pseudoxanthomonas kalamensis DSM 18571]|nr:multidrug ABC transporter ATP-binding protein [Pseudoxanthomonas kalamensis DSM 18571]
MARRGRTHPAPRPFRRRPDQGERQVNAVTNQDAAQVVSARGLRKHYKNKLALDDTAFGIDSGRIVGLIGPNGAGKTTALKAILGLIPFEGELKVLGLDPRSQRDELMEQVCFIADVAVLPRWMRVKEAIDFVEGVHPRFDRAKCERFLAGTQLGPNLRVREMSKGMIVQLHLALVMAIDARLLVLDEPTLGLDILYRKQFYQRLLEDYFDENKTILVTTHQVEEIEHILTDVMFIRDGKIALTAQMDEVADRYTEVLVSPDTVAEARSLQPIDERALPFGKTVLLFDGVPRERLAALGETRAPGLADLFVAIMKGTYA